MAIHQRTIRFGFQTKKTSLAAATRNDFTAITLYQPMTSSPTWRSCLVRVWARVDETTAKDVTSRLIGIKLGAAAFDDQTVTDTQAHSGEHTPLYYERDVTSYFVTNWTSGATKTCQVGVQFGGVATINITVELVLTFDAADSNTRIRTVEIPLESSTTVLSASLTEIGTNQIPILTGAGGFLKEPSPTIRDWYLRIEGNEADVGGTNDYALGLQIDGDAEEVSGNFRQNLASSCSFAYIYSRTGSVPTTTAVHAFKARSNNLANRFVFAATLVVTYEYDHSTATRILNAVTLPMIPVESKQQVGAGDATDFQRFQVELLIEEPGTITLEQSGIVVYYGGAITSTNWLLSNRAGAQAAFRDYTVPTNGATWCGTLAHALRVDSGSALGAAFTLFRGRNVLTFDHYGSITNGSVPQPVLYLNYSSDLRAEGDGAHKRTVMKSIRDSSVVAANVQTSSATAPILPETNVYYDLVAFRAVPTVNAPFPAAFWLAEVLGGEGMGEGWVSVMGGMHNSVPLSPKLGVFVCAGNAAREFQRWTGDPDTARMDPQAARRWRVADGFTPTTCLTMLLTYHAITPKEVVVYAKNFPSGDGSGIPYWLHSADTGEILLTGVSVVGGTATVEWFDDTEDVRLVFRQSGNFRGVSDDL